MPDGGPSGSKVSSGEQQSPVEIFQQGKEKVFSKLEQELREALKGVEGSPEGAAERMKALATDKMKEALASFGQMYDVLEDESKKLGTQGEQIQETIRGLQEEVKKEISAAWDRFERGLAEAVKASKPKEAAKERSGADIQQEIAILEKKKKPEKGRPKLTFAKQLEIDGEIKKLREEMDGLKVYQVPAEKEPIQTGENTSPSTEAANTEGGEAKKEIKERGGSAEAPQAAVEVVPAVAEVAHAGEVKAEAAVIAVPDAGVVASSSPDTKSAPAELSEAERKVIGERVRNGRERLKGIGETIKAFKDSYLHPPAYAHEIEDFKNGYKLLLDADEGRLKSAPKTELQGVSEMIRTSIAQASALRDFIAQQSGATKKDQATEVYASVFNSLMEGIREYVPEFTVTKVEIPTPDAAIPASSPSPDATPPGIEVLEKVIRQSEARWLMAKSSSALIEKLFARIIGPHALNSSKVPGHDQELLELDTSYNAVVSAESSLFEGKDTDTADEQRKAGERVTRLATNFLAKRTEMMATRAGLEQKKQATKAQIEVDGLALGALEARIQTEEGKTDEKLMKELTGLKARLRGNKGWIKVLNSRLVLLEQFEEAAKNYEDLVPVGTAVLQQEQQGATPEPKPVVAVPPEPVAGASNASIPASAPLTPGAKPAAEAVFDPAPTPPDAAVAASTPDAASVVPLASSPDKPVSVEPGVFEEAVAEDEVRLAEVKALVDNWPKGDATLREEPEIKKILKAYEELLTTERAYLGAGSQETRHELEQKMKRLGKGFAGERAPLAKLIGTFDTYLKDADKKYAGNKNGGKVWRKVLESRKEVLDKLNAFNPADRRTPSKDATRTPDAADAPKDAAPDAPPVETPKTPEEELPVKGSMTLEETLVHEGALLKKLEELIDKMGDVAELDSPDGGEEHSDLGEVSLCAKKGFDLLGQALKEPNEKKREHLLVQRRVFLEDPKIQAKAEVYMKRMALFMRGSSPEEMQSDTELATRIAILETLAEIFPDIAKKIGHLKGVKEEMTTLEFVERRDWQKWVGEHSKRLKAAEGALAKSTEDEWYKKNKGAIDAGVAFQAELVRRTEAVLAAKTPAERQKMDKALIDFRRTVAPMAELVPDQSLADVRKRLNILEGKGAQEAEADENEDKEKKVTAKEQAEIDALQRQAAVLELVEDKSMLHTGPSEQYVANEQWERKKHNAFEPEEKKWKNEEEKVIRKEIEQAAADAHAEMRGKVSGAKETRAAFVTAFEQYKPHESTSKLFSPIYEAWGEEQEASLALVDGEREESFLDHAEIWAEQGVRTLDQQGDEEMTEEAWKELTEGGDGKACEFVAKWLEPGERGVEAVKARLYEIMRVVMRWRIKAQAERVKAEAAAQKVAGAAKAALEKARGNIEAEIAEAAIKLKRLRDKIAGMNPIRLKSEGAGLVEQEKILTRLNDRAREQKEDIDALQQIIAEDKTPSEPNGAGVPFVLEAEVAMRMVAIMRRQTERGQTTEKNREEEISAIYKKNPWMMNTPIISTGRAKAGGEIKRETAGGGNTKPGGIWEDIKNSAGGRAIGGVLKSIFGS